MPKTQEEIFYDIEKLTSNINRLAGYVQNDINPIDDDCPLTIEELRSDQSSQSNDFDVLINKLSLLKQECFAFYEQLLPKQFRFTGKEIKSMLISYWFSKIYTFVKSHAIINIDYDFIESHNFYVTVTSTTSMQGSDNDVLQVQKLLAIGKTYQLLSMSVGGQSDVTIELNEFPGCVFNSANFEFLPEYTKKHLEEGCVTYE